MVSHETIPSLYSTDKIVGFIYAELQKYVQHRLVFICLPAHLHILLSPEVKCNPIFEYTKYCCWVIVAFLAGVRVFRY